MEPFDSYDKNGKEPLGTLKGRNSRHERIPELIKLSKRRSCVYCGMKLTDTYQHWLLSQIDHVIPRKAGHKIGIEYELLDDYWNIVLCCSACNGFNNRKGLKEGTSKPNTNDEFVKLRDEIFLERKDVILKKHKAEEEFFLNNNTDKVKDGPV